MTTFHSHGGSLPKFTALVAATALLACACALAPPQPGPVVQGDNPCGTAPAAASDNEYVLLLFYADPSPGKPANPGFPSCVTDPDTNLKSILMQGGCPTDCGVKPSYSGRPPPKPGAARPAPGTKGDPLTNYPDDYWAIFFADPNGVAETSPDSQANFHVWEIVAKDACHAGKILKLLKQQYPHSFEQPYLGELMIGHSPPTGKPSGTSSCS